jgi:hypothetical protein
MLLALRPTILLCLRIEKFPSDIRTASRLHLAAWWETSLLKAGSWRWGATKIFSSLHNMSEFDGFPKPPHVDVNACSGSLPAPKPKIPTTANACSLGCKERSTPSSSLLRNDPLEIFLRFWVGAYRVYKRDR